MVTKLLKVFFVSIFLFIAFSINPNKIHAAPPLTGTFISADLGTNNTSDYHDMIEEMKSSGIDTIIIPIGEVTKDCNDSISPFVDYFYLNLPNRNEATVIDEALQANMHIFFGLRNSTWSPCINATIGTPADDKTAMGHLINHSISVVSQLKTYLTNKSINWNTDPRIAGFYIPEEIETYYLSDLFPNGITYYKEVSSRLVSYSKPIMFSPWQSDRTSYSLSLQAYKNIISKTNITIIAPQDSMGSEMTTSLGIDKDHFRALADAKNAFPNKNISVWANIEIFQNTSNDPTYTPDIPNKPVSLIPAPITRITQQISTASPYVSKMIMWIYQHNLMTIKGAINAYAVNGWNIMYTPGMATRRSQLRSDYLAAYPPTLATCSPLYIYNIASKQCGPTSAKYSSTQNQCDANNNVLNNTCQDNLATYPGITTGICYPTQIACETVVTISPSSFISFFQTNNIAGDLDKNGNVDIFDYNLLVAYYK